jgi:hypothetical protein
VSFDWIDFLSSRHIPFVTSGSSATKGNVAIKCPWCHDDPSQHLAISTEGRGWRCWRRKEHAGKSDAFLVAKLIKCSMEDARAITGQKGHLVAGFAQRLGEIMGEPEKPPQVISVDLPGEFRRFSQVPGKLETPFVKYMRRRGFSELMRLSVVYEIGYCRRGPLAYRIVFPIRFNGEVVNLTARTITDSPLRYMTLPKEQAAPISDFLLWYDELRNQWDADTIILCEGPFDALKVNYLGEGEGIVSTCFFTSSPSDRQIDLLHELLPRFKNRYLLQDEGAYAVAMRTHSALRSLGVENLRLPQGAKDPGDMSPDQFRALCREQIPA